MGDLIIGSAAVAQTTTPGVSRVAPASTPTPQTTATPAAQSVAGATMNNAAAAQSFISQVAGQILPNPLNQYWQPTYHFKLFMAGDEFTLDGISNYNGLISQINSNSIKQVIIAETGVTGYNIKDVEIDTVNAQNGYTRDQKATVITMTITEPLGISFLDAIFSGAAYLRIFDYTKVNYFLMLSFTGYNSDAGTGTDGSYAGNPIKFGAPFKNGGQWLWSLKFSKIEVKLNEGGGVYKLTLTSTEAESVIFEDKIISTMTDGLTVEGATLGAMFDDFAQKLTAKWKEKFPDPSGRTLMQFKIVTHPLPRSPSQDPKNFPMINTEPDKSSIHALKLDSTSKGIPTAHIGPSTTVNEFITSAIKSTEQGQKLIVDDPTPQNPDVSGGQATPTGNVRTSTLFSIEPVIDNVATDPKTGNYGKVITIHVIPHRSQTAIIDPAQRDDAKNPAVQRQMIQELMTDGFLKKEYDYIFTGLNTEVIDFNIDFLLAYQPMLPKLGGARSQALNETTNASYNPNLTVAPHPDVPPPDMTATNISPVVLSPNGTGGRVYIEDILNSNNQGQGVALPISFWPHYVDIENELATGLTAQWHPGQSIAATIFAQVFASTMTSTFQRIELTIRGDPYWLGMSNLERRVVLSGSSATNDTSNIPDFSSGNPAMILKFQYPLQLGDDFKPILKDSVVFNGIYEVYRVKHSFSEGAFKQTLMANRMSLINLGLASSSAPYTNTDGSSSGATGGQSGSQGGPNGNGSTPGSGNSTIAPTGSLPNSQQLQGLAQESYNFWVSNGYSPAGAAAMVSQEEAEGQFGTAQNLNVPGVQAGNFQWSPSRAAAIQAATGINVSDPTTTHQQQLQAALWEQTQGPYKNVGSALMTATDPGAAGVLATTKYEIPAKTQVQAQIRGGRAAFWGQQYGPTSTTTAS